MTPERGPPGAASSFSGRVGAARRRAREISAALERLYPKLVGAAEDGVIPTGAEWLLDNHFVVRRALRRVETGLVGAFERRLPRARDGVGGRLELRVRALLREHEGLLDRGALLRWIRGYGEEFEAKLAELWALPLVLRLALLEQLVLDGRELLERPPAGVVDQRVGNCVRSLLWIEKLDWSHFVEAASEVDEILRADPAGAYAQMAFETRDRYRRAVEDLARCSGRGEAEVARLVVAHAREADSDSLAAHVGFHLVDAAGREALRGDLEGRLRARLHRGLRRARAPVYLGGVGLIAAAHLVVLGLGLASLGAKLGLILALELLALVPALTIGVSLVNWIVGLIVAPTTLAKLDFSAGIPASCRSLVVVPAMLTGPAGVESLLRRLESHHLTTRDPNIELALATDFGDADEASVPGDEELVAQARAGIAELNQRYGDGGEDGEGPFHLLHRRRLWSARQGRWMGWERKRGKLEELNRLLCGDEDTTYVVHEGRELDAKLRYVITLDADTILPLGAGRRLIETLAHPLNVARFDAASGRLCSGYTVLQPRAEVTPDSAVTRYARTFAGDAAYDIYSRAVSNVYQDLFGEGSFVGKGIYDLRAFRRCVEDQLPCDRILSHDLIEGALGRAGLVSDVLVYEDYPASYLAHARRLHRWIRGDWQILAWLGLRVPKREGRVRNPLGLISRWKIADNLRRSLLAPSLVGFAIVAWLGLPALAWLWTALVLLVLATPTLTQLGGGVLGIRPGAARPAISGVLGALAPGLARCLLRLCFLADEAYNALDAIVRALVRTHLSGRRQLEWTPAAVAGRGAGEAWTNWRSLGPSSLAAAGLGLVLALVDLRVFAAASPLLLAWVLAPPLAIWTARRARPRRLSVAKVSPADPALHRLARRTWAYFERVVGPEDHWLPPDHFQEHPKGELAHRSSPTNVAMALLATLAAYDFGYVDLLELVVRLRDTLASVAALPRHRGHVLNWCDTRTLAPLEPRYVSTVDSGNLAAGLLVLEQSCRELAVEARPLARRGNGLRDGFDLLAELLAGWGSTADAARRQVLAMRREVEDIEAPRDWPATLAALDDRAFMALDAALLELFESQGSARGPGAFEELRAWATRCRVEVSSLRSEIGVQLPWLAYVAEPPDASAPAELTAALAPALAELERVPSLQQAQACYHRALATLGEARALAPEGPWRGWLDELIDALEASLDHAMQLRDRLEEIADLCAGLVEAMDFAFLYDGDRELLYIGYDVSAERFDEHHYDLLASEARIASLVGIAKGELPLRHWAKLGRPLGRFGYARALLSWSGTMFEYLMPPLLVDEGEHTLLDASARAAVRAQIDYGRRHGVPWGISESGYARLDDQRNYQYRAFGVPATGFRRGLERELVVAPYASLMALRYAPDDVVANLERLERAGGLGPLGAYEALDYTRERVPLGRGHAVVRSYMSHHQGMILLGLHGFCQGRAMVRRAHRHPMLAAVEMLLHERAPGRVPVERPQPAAEGPPARERSSAVEPWRPAGTGDVEAHLLGNRHYGLLFTASGAGHSWWRGLALTRPCDDRSLEDQGLDLRVRDLERGDSWSLRAGPDDDPETREVEFSVHGARVTVHERGLVATLELCVATEQDAELRLLHLSDRSGRPRRLEISAFTELVLDEPRAYARHPAFSKLFVDAQVCAEPPMIVYRRRPRTPEAESLWLGCMLVSDEVEWRGWACDRGAYLGRGGDRDRPLGDLRPLPGRDTPARATLDTCLALAGAVELEAGGSCSCAVVMIAAASRAKLLEQGRRLSSMAALRRTRLAVERGANERALAREQDTLTLRGYQRLLSALAFPRAQLRAAASLRASNRLGQPGLWRHGISGDWPLILVRLASAGASMVVELLRAQNHWRRRGYIVDLVLLEEQAAGYGGGLRQRLGQIFEREHARPGAADGGVFTIAGASLEPAERNLLLASASVIVDAEHDQLGTLLEHRLRAPLPSFEAEGQELEATAPLPRPDDLLLDNGVGGFTADGRAYLIHLEPGEHTPAPWVNVIANPSFGCVVSERGAGYSWSLNAGLNRITTWSNDMLLDPPSESIYLRDELDGELWSPTPGPAPASAPYQIRHGAGWTSFEHRSHGLGQRLEIFVAPDEPAKILRLELENLWRRPRRLTVSYCVEWLLGAQFPADARLLAVDFDPEHQVALASNPWNPSFAGRWAFAAASVELHGMSTSRGEFFGRRGSRARPAALLRIGLSGESSGDPDPCAVLQVHVDLAPGERTRLHFVLGQGEDREAAVELAKRLRDEAVVDELRAEVDRRWDELLGAVELASPDPGLDLLVNRWLLYQCISSRMWGRTGAYQSSGAFGFRDQLQDALALIHAAPELTRAQILDAGRRQYEAGDVQHWWHPPAGQGLRSRCSDDLLWLPFAVAHYVEATGDEALVHESTPFLRSGPLAEGELERYESDPSWAGSATIYEHCMAALTRADTRGVHELPLIGSCDWNDGFSRVGAAGRGESVWLGWFLLSCCEAFARICDRLGRSADAEDLRARAQALIEPLEAAWDGSWYRRAYDDEGRALGSAGAEACEIDSIAQSWAVISGRADPQRARRAMRSVRERLVVEEAELVRLFRPAFDSERPELGYIEAYPPGVRENGGQYTHAAIWVGWALAELGEADAAHEILAMILPTSHSRDLSSARRYRVEPYVIAADIYAEAPMVGRGGWTWYTGAAGWAYRLAVEQLLGLRRREGRITLDPKLPQRWPGCRLRIRAGGSEYELELTREPSLGAGELEVDGRRSSRPFNLPPADGRRHRIALRFS